eukprot:2176160-Pleurochrysis_carterae.AAC.1
MAPRRPPAGPAALPPASARCACRWRVKGPPPGRRSSPGGMPPRAPTWRALARPARMRRLGGRRRHVCTPPRGGAR